MNLHRANPLGQLQLRLAPHIAVVHAAHACSIWETTVRGIGADS